LCLRRLGIDEHPQIAFLVFEEVIEILFVDLSLF
jgi:hypothetical protein